MLWCKRCLAAVISVFILSVMMSVSLTSSARAQADIGLATLGDSMDPVKESSDYTYVLRLLNYGDQTAEETQLTLPIPKSVKFLAVTPAKQCSYKKTSNKVECDFGSLKAGADYHKDIQVTVRSGLKGARSVTLTATATTSSMELIATNNQQSETTTFFGQPSKGLDVGIARLEEVVSKSEDKIRSFELIVTNFGTTQAKNTKLQVAVPSLLKFQAVTPADACKFNKESGQLACELAMIDPTSQGDENTSVRLTLLDESGTLGAVKLKAIVLADGDDVVVANDMQELVVTLGSRLQKPLPVAKTKKTDEAPEVVAAIEKENTPTPAAAPETSSGGNSGEASAADTTSSAADTTTSETGTSTAPASSSGGSSGSYFSKFTSLFSGSGLTSQTSGPSGGNVDFQIQSFETDPDEVPAGSEFTLNTALINNGPGAANNAILDVTVPEGVAFVSGPGACTHDGNPPTGASHVNCSFGDIANAGTQSVPIVFRAVIPGRVVRTFSAEIDSASNETNAANNSQNVNFTISNGDDLLLAIIGAPNPAVAGGNVTYNLTVDNQGLNIAEGASVTFNLPPGFTYVGPGGGGNNGWGCAAAGQVVTCSSGANIAARAAGVNGTITFSVIASIEVGSGTYTASGTVYSTTTPDVDGANDTTTYDITVQPGTDLSVAKSVSDDPVMGGSSPSFTITVTNNGPITAQNLTLTDVLPADFGFVSAVGADWTCGNAGQTVTCTRPNMAVGSSDVVIIVNAPANNLIPEAGTNVINSATISSDTNDAVAGNDTGSVNFGLQRDGADLAVIMGRTPNPVAQNSDITNIMRVRNHGPRVATGNIRVTYLLATGETYQSFTGTGWGLNGQVGNLLTFEWVGTLAVASSTPTLEVITRATGTGVFNSRACTSSGLDAGTDTGLEPVEGDPVRSNNCVSDGVTSTAAIADLFVSKTAALDPQTTGDATQTYTLTVRNDGPDTAVDVHLTDYISNWVSAYNGRPATTVTATTPAGDCTISNAAIACDLNDIANGADAVVTVTVTRPVQGGAAIVNTASAYSRATGDNNRSNNVASVTTLVEFVTDLELRSAVWTPNPVKAGVEATYVLTIRNLGHDTAQNVALLSDFGGDFTFISATPSQGTCEAFGANVANRLDCDIGTMGYGANQTVTVVLRPNHQAVAPVPWEITNTTTVSTTTAETEFANNAGGINLDVVPAEIDLDVAQTDLVDPVAYNPGVPADNLITYEVTVNNFGPSYATGVNFTDSFTTPAGSHRLKFICDKAAPGDTCVEATAGQHCTGQGTIADNAEPESINCIVKKDEADQGEMAADTSYTRYLMYEVLDTPVAGGETHHKSVVINANENDPVPLNDVAEEQTTVRIRTDVAVVCAAPPASVSIRETFDLTLTVSNNGPGDSQETTLSETLPTGMVLTAQPSPASGGSCSGAAGDTSFSCDLGNLLNAASNVVTVPVRFVSWPASGNYTTTASVETNEIDTNAGNDSCSTAAAPVTRASIAGFVYEDHNDDGDMDGGETPIQGVTVQLTGTDAYGNAVNDTAVTGAAGDYKFWNRSPADPGGYTITETHPAGYADGQENAGGAAVVGGSHATDVISSIALAAGEDKVHYDFGELPADIEVVSKAPAPATVSLLEPFNYTIVVRNNGPAASTSSTLADNLPAGMELTAVPTTDVGTCTGVAGDGSLTCDFGTLANGAVANITVPVKITALPRGGSYDNTATASTDLTETNTANNTKTTPVIVVKSSIACMVYQDLNDNGTKEGGEPAIAGVPMSLTGNDAAGNVVSLTANTGADGSCLFDNLSPSDGTGYTLSETTQPATFGDGQENSSGTVVGASKTTDAITGIALGANTHLPTHEFGELPVDLEVTSKTADPVEVSRLQHFNYTIVVTNNGPGNAINSTLSDTLPAGMELTATPTSTLGTCTGNATETVIGCTLGTINKDDIVTVTVPVMITANPAVATYTNTAEVTNDLTDTNLANNRNTGDVNTVKSRISCVVYQDLDNDGVKQGGEPGIAGVPMTLVGTDDYGNAVSLSQDTAADGSCSFDNLSPSTTGNGGGYTLSETVQPAGFNDGKENNEGTVIANSGDGHATSDVIGPISLAANTHLPTHEFGEVPPTGLSGTVWCDTNNNGVIDGGENTLLAGVTITLSGVELNDDPIASVTATTDANGLYHFDISKPGTYTLTQDQSTIAHACNLPGQAAQGTGATTAGTPQSDVAANDYGNVITGIELAASDVAVAYNFGELQLAQIAGHVYLDVDGSDDRQNTESGIENVTVTLTCTDYRDRVVAPRITQTAADGTYSFADVIPSDGTGCTLTETHPLSYVDAAETIGSLGGTVGADVFTQIPVASNDNGVDYDFGERQTGLSGVVYYDPNNNGVVEQGETRIAGVTVVLTGTDASGAAVTRTETTDGSGAYVFTALPPSNPDGYTVTQTQPADYLQGQATVGTGAATPGTADNVGANATNGNVISGIVLSEAGAAINYNFGELRPASVAGLVYNDISRDGTRQVGEPGISGVEIVLTCTDHRGRDVTQTTNTSEDGTYLLENLEPSDGTGCTITETQPVLYRDGVDVAGTLGGTVGQDHVSAILLAAEDAGTGYDFAELSAGISGHVYVDSDNDGVFDNGETPLAGVVIELNGTDANGAVTRTTTTDVNGYYLFTGLSPSTGAGYTLTQPTQPAAWADGKDTAGSVGGTVVNDEISAIVLTATDFATDYDFGEVGGSLAGVVYTDLNNDGQQDGTESGIPGTTVALVCTTVNNDAYEVITTTSEDGSYIFADVPASDATGCTITETQPADTNDGLDRVGTLGGTLGNDILSAIPVGPGDEGVGYDFGEILTNPARISGHVWHDGNHDRSNNDGSPEEGWTVELISNYSCASPVTIVATQTTNAAGEYAFEGVSPGNYGIRFRSPTGGYVYAGTQSGGTEGETIPCGINSIDVVGGDDIVNQDLPLDPSGVVYDSLTRQPVPGATVEISCADPVYDAAIHLVGGLANVSQTTGADGYYQFLLHAGAPSCDYQLDIQAPEGFIPQDSAIIPVCTSTLTVGSAPAPALVQNASTAPTLSAGDHNPASCPTTSGGLAGGAGSTQYYHTFALTPGTSANVVNNHIPLDRVTQGAFTVSKTTPKVNVSIGQLVPYTITVSNNLPANLPNMEIEDQIPPGFKYKRGSASLDGVRSEPVINGRQLTWPGLTFSANQKRVVRLLMIVGSGVSEGEYVNRAWAENGFVQALASNVATAKVRVTPDPTFDCAGVIGKVFDDKNRNGYQDKGEKGLANVRLATVRGLLVTTDKYGRYHVACADIPNADRGSNFIMKLDHRTLPTGYRLTTENPRMIRLTRGKIGKLNFGVAIHRVVRLDITKAAFSSSCSALKSEWKNGIPRLVSVLDKGPSILRIAYARMPDEDRRSVRKCMGVIKKNVTRLWKRKRRRVLVIETESYLSAKGSFK